MPEWDHSQRYFSFFSFFVFRSQSEKTKNSINEKHHAAAGKAAFERATR
jgi:hypothetical protein